MGFKPASRKQKKLRMALSGPSGSGKTYTALALAHTLAQGGKVAVIDTERGSASLYSDQFEFDVCELDNFNPDKYISAIHDAAAAGYSVLVIDSLSHAWVGQGGVLDQVNQRGGNSFTDGWGKVGTPLQNRLMDAVLNAPLHIIATMRVKTDYVVEVSASGKSVPKRVGMKEVQRDGVEYEFDITATLDAENTLTIEKTRMMALAGQIVRKPDGKLADQILAWLNAGAPNEEPSAEFVSPPQMNGNGDAKARERWQAFCKEHGFTTADIEAALGTKSVATWMIKNRRTVDDAMSLMLAARQPSV